MERDLSSKEDLAGSARLLPYVPFVIWLKLQYKMQIFREGVRNELLPKEN
jgi:hypothetical protein